jgi:hypothetical protein
LIIPDNTFDKGRIRRGKYTLPKILALSVKVFEVTINVSEK